MACEINLINMKKLCLLVIFVFASIISSAQYWFGPKIGLNYINPIYQDKTIEDDLDVDDDFDINVGFALNYAATDVYSIYGEVIYERVNRNLQSKFSNSANPITIQSNTTNQFITIPLMLRVSLGKAPFHYYVNGGPKVSYWLGGKGEYLLPSFQEEVALDPVAGNGSPLQPLEYKLTFNSNRDNEEDVLLVSEPNRFQFGLVVGTGILFDLLSGSRLMLDFRYTFGHSNMGFDSEEDVWFVHKDDNYVESFEYSLNIASISVAYLFEYDTGFKRKGRSTNRAK